jgi:hypothetical protein
VKALDPLVFDLAKCRVELDRFKLLLETKKELQERNDLLPLFRECPHLTAFIATQVPKIGLADRLGYEFQIFGDFTADIVIGNSRRKTYCAIELEDAHPGSVFNRHGSKATTEWGSRLEHGFNQLVDWFFAWDDHKKTEGFAKQFGYGHVEFFGMLLVGRSADVSEHDRVRLRWRSGKVAIDSHQIYCNTYDDLYDSLAGEWRLLPLASSSGTSA